MSNVELRIGGRSYTVACAAGEEAHVTALGQTIDAKLQSLGMSSQGETRQMLFAALMLADELHEAQKPGDGAPPPPSPAPPPPAPPTPAIDPAFAEQLEALADRLENCAAAIEDGALEA